jgi:hypothetical protein
MAMPIASPSSRASSTAPMGLPSTIPAASDRASVTDGTRGGGSRQKEERPGKDARDAQKFSRVSEVVGDSEISERCDCDKN